MVPEQVITAINAKLIPQVNRGLSDLEIELLRGAWANLTYEEIAETSGYSLNYLQRDIGPKFWKLLSQAYGRKLNKTNARAILSKHAEAAEALEGQHVSALTNPSQMLVALPEHVPAQRLTSPFPTSSNRIDWGEAPDVSNFYGRQSELDTLAGWLLQDRCRLVALLGMGGMGKSSLAAKIVHQLQHEFEFIIWRSLRNAPPLPTLLAELVPFLSEEQDTQGTPERLLHWLKAHRCLIVLDNLETLIQAGNLTGDYLADYEDYGDLLRLLSETVHQSCVLLTSREKPIELSFLEDPEGQVRSHTLSGSWEAALALISARALIGTEAEQRQLCDFYACSPLAIKIVSASIQTLFGSDIAAFLAEETTLFNGIRRLLDQQFERLSPLEQALMVWLAINREWTDIATLQEDMVPPVARSSLLEALESLSWRNLVEIKGGRATQQPVVMEYVTEQWIQTCSQELLTGQIDRFNAFALTKTTVPDYVRDSQVRLVVGPIANELRTCLGTDTAIQQQLQTILTQLKQPPPAQLGYAGGNLINLHRHLGLALKGYNFSQLAVRHADLRDLDLHGVNFNQADLSLSVFQQTFNYVLTVDLSPDGETIAMGDGNGQVRLWRTADGQPLGALPHGATSWVWSVAWSQDGRWLASGGVNRVIKLWNPATEDCVHTLRGHDNWVRSLAWQPQGSLLASGSTDGTIKLWHPNTGNCERTIETGSAIWAVAWSPDGQQLVSGSIDQTLTIWDSTTGSCLNTLEGHTQWVRSVAWSPNGQQIASGGDDSTIRLWDVATGQCLASLTGHQAPIWSVVWSPDGTRLVSTSHDHRVKIWDVQTQQILRTLPDHTNWVWAAAWSRDNRWLVTVAHDRAIKIWDVATWRCQRTLTGFSSVPMALGWSPDGATLAGGCDDHVVRLWDTATGAHLDTLTGHSNVIWAVRWHPTGQWLASSCDDHTVKIWDVATGQCLTTLTHANWVWSVDWSPDGNYLATACQDYTVQVWKAATGEQLQTFKGHRDSIWQVRWNAQGTHLASACDDGTVRLWDVATGDCVGVLEHAQSVRSQAWSPDGSQVVTGSADSALRLWDVATGQCKRQFTGHQDALWSVAWHPHQPWLASGGDDQTVRLWHSQTGECRRVLKGHQSQIWSIAWSPDGTTLATSSADQTIRLWNTVTDQPGPILRAPRPYESMSITGATGITASQRATLQALGAVDQ